MLDFEVERCKHRCVKTDREFRPGETYYSALVPSGGGVERLDYSAEAWQGPPEGALGWWQARRPEPNAHKVHWAPNDIMLQYFEQLEGQPDVRYVLALLMVRRRVLRLEAAETDPEGRETLVLHCGRNDTEYRVPVVFPEEPRIAEIQHELARLLYSDAEARS